jgi:hypothetical protein
LGVLDLIYSDANGGDPSQTTGEVAEKLEKRYHIMEIFYDSRKHSIADYLAEDMAASLNNLIKRGKAIKGSGTVTTLRLKQWYEKKGEQRVLTSEQSSLTYGADQKIERDFRKFIFSNELQKLSLALTGAPISQAAASGVNHRFKRPYARKNKARPAFVDTGLYVASMRSWVTKT